jgi:DNA polymerase-1
MPAVIQAKHAPLIQKGNGMSYDPATFAKQHAISNFLEIDDPQQILDMVKPLEFAGHRLLFFDTETHPYFRSSHDVPSNVVRRWVGTGKKATPQDYPFCISLCDGVNSYVLYDSYETGFTKLQQLAPLFEDPTIEKVAHNVKFDMHQLANVGMRIVGRLHDTVVLAKLANENRNSFQLRDLAGHLKTGVTKFEFMVDTYKQMYHVTDYRDIPRELMTQYTCADTWNCCQVFMNEWPKIVADGLVNLYDNECELTVVLYAMERYGMRTNPSYHTGLVDELTKQTEEAEAAIYTEAGGLFNINSTKQLYDVLMRLNVSPSIIPLTAKGNPQLNKYVLQNLAEVHNVSIVKKILEFRQCEKLLTTYAVGIYDQVDEDNKAHGSINQTEATTGRMSITKPALQTLPKRNKSIRKMFIPDQGYKLWFMDLDQVEYRLFSHYAKIPGLIEQINNGYDVHAATAATLFNKDLATLVKKVHEGDDEATALRSRAKTLNFALIYGMGNQALANDLKISVSEATEIKQRYFAQMPEARTFINTVYEVIKVRGFIKNFYGRRRRLDTNDCYKAPNALIQGCAADYIKHKMVNIYKFLKANNYKTHLINVVHDEIVIQMAEDEEYLAPTLRWLLSDFESFRVKITAGVEYGNPSWGEKVEPEDIGFKAPDNFDYLNFNVYDGSVFDINRK